MLLLATLGCIHTPPHDPVPGTVAKDFVRREEFLPNGEFCSWEAENLVFEGRVLWGAEPPPEEHWCVPPGGESSRWVDIVGQDGPYLSVVLHEWSCCPEHASLRCVTLDVRSGEPITLVTYDERNAARRWERARKHAPDGWTVMEDAFLVGDGHVRFCAFRGLDVHPVPVR